MIIEEIFGEIEDEHDNDVLLEEVVSKNEYRFSARTDIDYINEKYKLNIEDREEFETLGGFVIHHLEEIPKAGTRFFHSELDFLVEAVSDNRIEIIKISKR